MGTTNITPAHIDRRLFVDVESLLGRAAATAHRHRPRPRPAAPRGRACLDLRDEGLRTVTSENLETAVERMATGELTLLYSEGYERIFARLERLHDSSSSWLHDETTLALLPGADMALRRWSRIVPESWTVPSQDGGEDVAIEPQAELLQFGD